MFEWLAGLLGAVTLAVPAFVESPIAHIECQDNTCVGVVSLARGSEFLSDPREAFKDRVRAEISALLDSGSSRVILALTGAPVASHAKYRMVRLAEICNARKDVSCLNLRRLCGDVPPVEEAECFSKAIH